MRWGKFHQTDWPKQNSRAIGSTKSHPKPKLRPVMTKTPKSPKKRPPLTDEHGDVRERTAEDIPVIQQPETIEWFSSVDDLSKVLDADDRAPV